MKEWIVIHKVKSLYDEGRGESRRAIAMKLGISRDTVRKYIDMKEEEIQRTMAEDAVRQKKLDGYKDSIIRTLQTFPRMSAVKVLRKLKEKIPDLAVSDRSMRRYIGELKAAGEVVERIRRYEPVVDMLPGMQCQVDGGELHNVLIGGVERAVYFIVFVLSCSRLMHVCASLKPIATGICSSACMTRLFVPLAACRKSVSMTRPSWWSSMSSTESWNSITALLSTPRRRDSAFIAAKAMTLRARARLRLA